MSIYLTQSCPSCHKWFIVCCKTMQSSYHIHFESLQSYDSVSPFSMFSKLKCDKAETEDDDFEPPRKKIKGVKRFADSIPDEYGKECVCKNMAQSNVWAMRTFQAWMMPQNGSHCGDKCPDNILSTDDPDLLQKWLIRFLIEAKKANGEQYNPCSLQQLLCGLH